MLEAREDGFARWLADYKTAADSNASSFGGYTKTAAVTGFGLAVLRFNDSETAKQTYADSVETPYTDLSAALAAAKTAYDTATDRTAGSSRAAVIAAASDSGCAAHYDREIARLKTLFSSAETAARTSIADEARAVSQVRLAAAPAITGSDTIVSYTRPVSVITRNVRTCEGTVNQGACWERIDPEPPDCEQNACRWRRIRFTFTPRYTCLGVSYSIAGTVTRTYKGTDRSASYSTTYTHTARAESETACPRWTAARTGGYSFSTRSEAYAHVMGSGGTASSLPTQHTRLWLR